MTQFDTIEELREWAAEQGVRLSKSQLDAAYKAMAAEQERLVQIGASNTAENRIAAFWQEVLMMYPDILQGINRVGDIIISLIKSIIVNFGVPVALVLLMVVEQQRVYEGIKLFEERSWAASFASWSLIISNLVLEVIRHYIEHKAGYEESRKLKWSVRVWWRNFKYRLGLSNEWQAVEQSPAARFNQLLRLITFTILILALAGSMSDAISKQDGVWYDAALSILTESSLSELNVWISGLLFAIFAVLGAQGLSRYVAVNSVDIVEDLKRQARSLSGAYERQGQKAGVAYLLPYIADRIPVNRSQVTVSDRSQEASGQSIDGQMTGQMTVNNRNTRNATATDHILWYIEKHWDDVCNKTNTEVRGLIVSSGVTVSQGSVSKVMKYVRTLCNNPGITSVQELLETEGGSPDEKTAKRVLEIFMQ